MSLIKFINVQQPVLGMLFQQTLYNVEDTVIDFQNKIHKSANLCGPRHMEENLWTSCFSAAIELSIFNLVRAPHYLLPTFLTSLSVLLSLSSTHSLSFWLQIGLFLFRWSSVQTCVHFHLLLQLLAKQNGSTWEIGKVGLVPSVSSAKGHQFASLSSSWHMTLTLKTA